MLKPYWDMEDITPEEAESLISDSSKLEGFIREWIG
jgi:hypothetical protein